MRDWENPKKFPMPRGKMLNARQPSSTGKAAGLDLVRCLFGRRQDTRVFGIRFVVYDSASKDRILFSYLHNNQRETGPPLW